MNDNVKSWIKKAEEDALAAKILLNSEFLLPATVCFHCQQMAEKYIKAYLTNDDANKAWLFATQIKDFIKLIINE